MLFCCLFSQKKCINSQILDVNRFDQLSRKHGFFVLSSDSFICWFESNEVYFEQHGAGKNAQLLFTVYITREDDSLQTQATRFRLTFVQLGDYRL